ncbi:hypothetical protein Poli38472_009281 [Pythium oligandrum]|uniref:CDC20/Fizzy WD40 domain-containing protein n=1 Tax=Pythium oligandrum TaxID=41045 RepID=A0A8K1FLC2_PYTOL|nr:hypothetical protein Poli38472_009281 [Pythium oligandrum]|eukprot:TMW65114.1 hypothetical protein Poli38472_009281 [Pythium oligandrum]
MRVRPRGQWRARSSVTKSKAMRVGTPDTVCEDDELSIEVSFASNGPRRHEIQAPQVEVIDLCDDSDKEETDSLRRGGILPTEFWKEAAMSRVHPYRKAGIRRKEPSGRRSPMTTDEAFKLRHHYNVLQSALTQEDRVNDSNWLTSTFIDLMLWRLASQYHHTHFLPTDFCHFHLPSVFRRAGKAKVSMSDFDVRDVLGRPIEFADTRPIVFVANVGGIHWNLFRVQFEPQAELQLFEPMGRLSSRTGISYRSIPREVLQWLDVCYPEHQNWRGRTVSAITHAQQISGFDCGVACLLAMRPLDHQYAARLERNENNRPPQSGGVDSWTDLGCQSSPLPHKTLKRSRHIYSDRFIPSRLSTKLETRFELQSEPSKYAVSNNQNDSPTRTSGDSISNTAGANGASTQCTNPSGKDISASASTSYSMLLKSELLGIEPPAQSIANSYFQYMDSDYDMYSPPTARSMLRGSTAFDFTSNNGTRPLYTAGPSTSQNMLRFKSSRSAPLSDLKAASIPFSGLGAASHRMISGPSATRRKIARTPFKMLDAPSLQDDFYLNLVDWSSMNVLAVGLASCVYLWSACTSKVTKLCDLGPSDCVTSVAWSQRGTHLSVGTNTGHVQLWDVASGKKVRTMTGHVARVGTLAWNSQLLASGSRDRMIYLRDIRSPAMHQNKLVGHKQEVCGLKWSFDDRQLASGGNDNKLLVWSLPASCGAGASVPVVRFSDHTAAVKAIAWSPHQHGLLASGGGTADRCIRFWNTHTNTALQAIDTGSQVCNLMWAKNVNEVVSTHGYSLNQIIVWKYPTMAKLATLTGHTFRVLYLAMSPDGQTIVTGAGDETLRFWNAFPSSKGKGGGRLGTSLLLPLGPNCNEIR